MGGPPFVGGSGPLGKGCACPGCGGGLGCFVPGWPISGAPVGGTSYADRGVCSFCDGSTAVDCAPGCLLAVMPGCDGPRGGTIGRGTPFIPGNGCPGAA